MSAIPNLPENVSQVESTTADDALRHSLNSKSETSKINGQANGEALWQIHDSPIENQRPIKVIVIGAGYSGIYMGIRIPERIRNCELVIYEKNDGYGGTWFVHLPI